MKKVISLIIVAIMILTVIPMAYAGNADINISVVNEKPIEAFCALSGGDTLPQEGGATIWRPGDWMVYNINVPKDGTYRMMFLIGGTIGGTFATDVYIDDELLYEGNGTIIGDYADRKETVLDQGKGSDIELTAGTKKLKIEHKGGGGHYFEAILFYDLGEQLELTGVKSGDISLIESGTLGRSAEAIEVFFSKAINPEYGKNIDLYTKEGELLNYAKVVSLNKVTLTLNETLEYGKQYVIKIGEIYDSFNYSKSEACDITFTVALEGLYENKIQELQDGFNSCTTWEEFETYFTENAAFIEVKPDVDLKQIQKDIFYAHFVGKTAENFNDIKNYYDKFLASEKMNQGSLPVLSKFLSSERNCLILGFEKALLDASGNRKSNIIRGIMSARPIHDVEELSKKIIEIIYDNLKIEYKKENLSFKASDMAVRSGQGFSVPVEFNENFSDLKAIEIEMMSDSVDLGRAEIFCESQNTSVVEENENYLKGIITFDELAVNQTEAEIKLIAPNGANDYSITLKGKAVFDVGIGYELETELIQKTISVKVTGPSSGSGSGGGRGSSRPSGGGGIVSMPIQKEENKFEEKFVFADAGEVEWAKESIIYLTDMGVLEKTDSGLFLPNQDITRDEFVKILVKALGIVDETAECTLNDIDKTNENYKYIASAQKHGIVLGNDKGMFMTGQNITRQDICVIIHRALKGLYSFEAKDNVVFTDDNEIAEYAKTTVYDIRSAGIIEGVGDNTFLPKSTLSKAMAAKMVFQVINAISKK